ncbi:hypothetical protein, partial [Salmonella sp. s54395]|uniref:hypothetical protein n=1 Tax=Salmonella sp. s54395 TaxID=3159664 RepID=UPI00397F431E
MDLRVSNTQKMTTFRDLYEEQTGTQFDMPKDKRLSKQTMRSYLQQSFNKMEDEWGIFENADGPLTPSRPLGTLTGGRFHGRVEVTDPNS